MTAKKLPFTLNENGEKVFDITGVTGRTNTLPEEAGSLVKDRHKLYRIVPDGSLRRLDKKRKRK